ncbi:MAG: tripartite tricarboxylate transporter TctB family protein [Thermodesulfobacteriota bacterium]
MNRDAASSLFWSLVGIGISYGGYDIGLGSLKEPGSGFIFFWLGLIVVGLASLVFVKSTLGEGTRVEMRTAWSGLQWKKVVWVLAALVFYAGSFQFLGFILATVILLMFFFKVVESQRWFVSVAWAVGATLLAYLLFQVWLGAQLPKGLLGL